VSAWVVASAHIDVLVLAGVQLGVPYEPAEAATPTPVALAATGADLWAENHRSVDHRYDQRTEPPHYPAPTAEVILDRVAVVKAVDCFVYQSCEHAGWPTSRAADYCRRLRDAAIAGLPRASAREPYPVGWDLAPWGIDDISQAATASPAELSGAEHVADALLRRSGSSC
jgi:hypothetical protein